MTICEALGLPKGANFKTRDSSRPAKMWREALQMILMAASPRSGSLDEMAGCGVVKRMRKELEKHLRNIASQLFCPSDNFFRPGKIGVALMMPRRMQETSEALEIRLKLGTSFPRKRW